MTLGKDAISVTHSKEQIIPSWAFSEASEFAEAVTFRWELAMTFDVKVMEMEEVTCSVVSGCLNEALILKPELTEFYNTVIPGVVIVKAEEKPQQQ